MTVKTRVRKASVPGGKTIFVSTGNTILESNGSEWLGRQKTTSTNHDRGRDGKYHEGGSFYTSDLRYDVPSRHVSFLNNGGTTKYVGPLWVNPPSASGMSPRSEDLSDLDSYGTTAISRISPTNSCANLAQQVGELHQDGIKRSLPGVATWQNRSRVLKAAGSEYLSAVFGWLPLVDEIGNLANTVRTADDHIKIYREGAGRNSHREFEYPEEHTVTESTTTGKRANTTPNLGTSWWTGSGGTLTTRVETRVRRWFSGSFTYPDIPEHDALGRMRSAATEANYLLGTTLTPDVLWELTPWSWAVDWFSNAGEVVNNFTNMSVNGLVMRYGYIMEETSTIKTNTLDHSGFTNYNGPAPSSSVTLVTKVRGEANPFGFGLSWEGLSPSQMLITAALGITKLR